MSCWVGKCPRGQRSPQIPVWHPLVVGSALWDQHPGEQAAFSAGEGRAAPDYEVGRQHGHFSAAPGVQVDRWQAPSVESARRELAGSSHTAARPQAHAPCWEAPSPHPARDMVAWPPRGLCAMCHSQLPRRQPSVACTRASGLYSHSRVHGEGLRAERSPHSSAWAFPGNFSVPVLFRDEFCLVLSCQYSVAFIYYIFHKPRKTVTFLKS